MADPIPLTVLGDTLEFVASLHPAVAVLQTIFQQVAEVQHNRNKCLSVFERAKTVVRKINDGLRGVAITPHLQNSINQLLTYASI